MNKDFEIAQTIKEAYLACQLSPLEGNDPRYVDFSEVRGEDVRELIKTHLDFRREKEKLRLALTSERGCGKTTELLRLKQDISDKYAVIYFEANLDLDPYNIEYSDLMMYLGYAVESHMRSVEKQPINEDILNEVARWFQTITKEDANSIDYSLGVGVEARAGGELPFFAKLMGYLTSALKAESQHRESIRMEVRKYPRTLIDNLNYLLDDASQKLAQKGKELLILIDSLDRYDPGMMDALLVKNKELLGALRVHLIFTPHLSLLYCPMPSSERLVDIMSCVDLPAIKLKDKNEPVISVSSKGINLLLEVVKKRIDIERVFQTQDDVLKIIMLSGGSIRDLLKLIQYSCIKTSGEKISSEAVERAIKSLRAEYKTEIPLEYYPDLAQIAINKDIEAKETHRTSLYRRYALKYNGENRWVDVHPIIYGIEAFKKAFEEAGGKGNGA